MATRTAARPPAKGVSASFVTHLECSATGERHPAGTLHGLSRAGAPLLVRYDLKRLARAVGRQ
jgi:threonine synthase